MGTFSSKIRPAHSKNFKLEPHKNICDDPLYIYEPKDTCLLLTVKVLRGTNVSKGKIADMVDTPDPYIVLSIKSSPEDDQSTTHCNNNKDPEWNQTFKFHLDKKKKNVMEVTLMEYNILRDTPLGKKYVNINKLHMDETTLMTLTYNKITKIELELHLSSKCPSDIRFGPSLCQEEEKFIHNRKKNVMTRMQSMFGDDAPRNMDEVPTIGVLGSGGGFRAMIGFNGAIVGLEQAGILDIVTYMAGLSGSTWYMANLYSSPQWPSCKAGDLQEELKETTTSCVTSKLLSPRVLLKYKNHLKEKEKDGQKTTLVDYFGYIIGEMILRERMEVNLSDQQEKVGNANIPFPLYSCVHLKNKIPATAWHEWLEFNPYGVGIPKYGMFIPIKLFGNKFFLGRAIKNYDEQRLHFFIGIWGSAFSISFTRLLLTKEENVFHKDQDIHYDLEEKYTTEDEEVDLDESSDSDCPTEEEERGFLETLLMKTKTFGSRDWHSALLPNFLYEFPLVAKKTIPKFNMSNASLKHIFNGILEPFPTKYTKAILADAGIAYNLPFPLLLRPQRAVDIILSFDFSKRKSDDGPLFSELKLAELWAKKHKMPFPEIDENIVEREGVKECYIFRGKQPGCPIIIHFPLVNVNFRKEKAPGVPRETQEELDFGNFKIWDTNKFSTFRFKYSEENFNRLTSLVTYNTLKNIEVVKTTIKEQITLRREAHAVKL